MYGISLATVTPSLSSEQLLPVDEQAQRDRETRSAGSHPTFWRAARKKKSVSIHTPHPRRRTFVSLWWPERRSSSAIDPVSQVVNEIWSKFLLHYPLFKSPPWRESDYTSSWTAMQNRAKQKSRKVCLVQLQLTSSRWLENRSTKVKRIYTKSWKSVEAVL